MRRKKYRVNKKKILGIILGIVLLMGFLIFLMIVKRPKIGEQNEIKKEKYLVSKISYPILGEKNLDQMIDDWIQNAKKSFFETAHRDKPKDPYELNISHSKHEYKGILFTEFTLYEYTGGNHYKREEKSYYLNKKTNKLLTFSDFFLEGKDYLNEISKYAYEYVKQYASKKGKTFDEALVKNGTDVLEENFKHFYFSEEGLTIIFPPYQVSGWADSEVRITIPYNKINRYLKEEYRKKIEDGTELPNVTRPMIDLSYTKGKKLIAFTFDDGPSSNTASLLDGLKERNARVTFFVLGNRISQSTDIIRREYEEGHVVGSHTYSHLNLLKLPEAAVDREIKATNEAVKQVLGEDPIYIRPPYGNVNTKIKQIMNMYIILWDVDTLDWKSRNADAVYQKIMDSAGDGKIVLLHDLYKTSIEGTLKAMDALKDQGYAFVTIEEMVKLKGLTLDKTKSYTEFISKKV